ncbi:MAG: hypothetical protein AUI53_03825 [Acidobacteria bacterium 13_1_40CM_2_60_7]|nr:MAG: hypothetical protein AUI53_03825 [Acidobacteria bacterium 13_1_40CM_2_60_7]
MGDPSTRGVCALELERTRRNFLQGFSACDALCARGDRMTCPFRRMLTGSVAAFVLVACPGQAQREKIGQAPQAADSQLMDKSDRRHRVGDMRPAKRGAETGGRVGR